MSGLSESESEALMRVQNYLGCLNESESFDIDDMTFGSSVYALTVSDLRVIAEAIDRIPALLSQARKSAVNEALTEAADAIDLRPTFPLPPSVISALVRERRT